MSFSKETAPVTLFVRYGASLPVGLLWVLCIRWRIANRSPLNPISTYSCSLSSFAKWVCYRNASFHWVLNIGKERGGQSHVPLFFSPSPQLVFANQKAIEGQSPYLGDQCPSTNRLRWPWRLILSCTCLIETSSSPHSFPKYSQQLHERAAEISQALPLQSPPKKKDLSVYLLPFTFPAVLKQPGKAPTNNKWSYRRASSCLQPALNRSSHITHSKGVC